MNQSNTDILSLKIENIRNISYFDGTFPIKNGIYAICGENGVGKSSIFAALSQIVYKSALNKYFSNEIKDGSKIEFELNGIKNTFVKHNISTWKILEENITNIFCKGSLEASIIYGNRFNNTHKSLIRTIINTPSSKYDSVVPFIKENLGKILKNDEKYYENLKCCKEIEVVHGDKKQKIKELYAIEKNGDFIYQHKMSSGENLIVSLLGFIHSKINKSSSEVSLILLDEVDLALHPAAQDRLLKLLQTLKENYNLCIYISTHSPIIISQLSKENIYLIEKDIHSKHMLKNPCYPGYVLREISNHITYDKVIIVEDELAKFFIEKLIRDRFSKNNFIYTVMKLGTYDNVIRYYYQLEEEKILNTSCKVIAVIDGDMKEIATKEFGSHNLFSKIGFLPIPSLEKFIYKNLYSDKKNDFYEQFENRFCQKKSLKNIIIETNRAGEIKENGKYLFKSIISKILEQNSAMSREQLVSEICYLSFSFIEDDDMNELVSFLTNSLDI